MGSLYDDSIFKKREEAIKRQDRTRNILLISVIVLVALVAGGVYLWRLKQKADLQKPAAGVAREEVSTRKEPADSKLVNLNTASATELQALPGIGPALAHDIVNGRPYKNPEDLKSVKGIGDKTFEKIRPLVRVK